MIVDVQKSFRKFFSEMYIHELKKYCKEFKDVYQIWDNHSDEDADKDYLYSDNPIIPVNNDLYNFPNQRDLIEKRYNYDVDVDFYKKVLSNKVYKEVKEKEDNNTIKVGDYFPTKGGTYIVFIGNKHKWYHLPKKLYEIFLRFKEAQNDGLGEIVLVGGASGECLTDIEVAAKVFGVKLKINHKFLYSANHCPIR